MDLRALFPELLPNAIAWAKFQSQHVYELGATLPKPFIPIAQRVGVKHPELIRTKLVDRLPLPEDPILKQAAIESGLLGPNMVGLTFGHSIFLVSGHETDRLIAHECRHVFQYELFGSIDNFLFVYLQQIIEFGYQDAPLEVDARAKENIVAGRNGHNKH